LIGYAGSQKRYLDINAFVRRLTLREIDQKSSRQEVQDMTQNEWWAMVDLSMAFHDAERCIRNWNAWFSFALHVVMPVFG